MLGVAIFTFITFIISIILVLTHYQLNKEDQTVKEVLSLLPGYNCGSCGFAGCSDMALNIVKKGVDPNKCRPMKEEQYSKLKEYLEKR